MRTKAQQFYHHYDGGECVARYPMHQDASGATWFTGPITLTGYDSRVIEDGNGKKVKNDVPAWDESRANEPFIPRQKNEGLAIRAIRRKLGEQPPGAGLGEGWGSIEAERKALGKTGMMGEA